MSARYLDGAPTNWRDCANDAERIAWLRRQLHHAHRASLRLSERAQNSTDRVIVRSAVHELDADDRRLEAERQAVPS